MKPLLFCIALLASLPAHALLAIGSPAPAFRLDAARAGKVVHADSRQLHAKGPLVLYFYPAAYTPGCSVEAQLFAQAMARFDAAGATVLGVSGDDLATLQRFSVSHCQGRFAVAADKTLSVAARYDAKLAFGQFGMANRVSYVISPEGRILSAHEDAGPASHVSESLKTVEEWRRRH